MSVDFIGPQLPRDWVAEGNTREGRLKGLALLMDRNKGRERVKILQKGEVKIEQFNDLPVSDAMLSEDQMRTSIDPDRGLRFGEELRGRSRLSFAKSAGRYEVVGPHGQRPQVLVCLLYGTGMLVIWCWYACYMVLVCLLYGVGNVNVILYDVILNDME